jgi:GNAT superfamily N-acetyltransferase
VRFAERADFGELMDLCQQLHAEDGLFSLALDRVEVMLLKHFEREGGLIGVIGGPDRLEGAIALHMTRMWYSDEWLLEEIFSYVRPEYRRSSNAKNLLHFGKSCAERIGVPLLASVVSSAHTEGKRGLYDRAFGPALGSFYIENRPANV